MGSVNSAASDPRLLTTGKAENWILPRNYDVNTHYSSITLETSSDSFDYFVIKQDGFDDNVFCFVQYVDKKAKKGVFDAFVNTKKIIYAGLVECYVLDGFKRSIIKTSGPPEPMVINVARGIPTTLTDGNNCRFAIPKAEFDKKQNFTQSIIDKRKTIQGITTRNNYLTTHNINKTEISINEKRITQLKKEIQELQSFSIIYMPFGTYQAGQPGMYPNKK